jgi:hypothetical protein
VESRRWLNWWWLEGVDFNSKGGILESTARRENGCSRRWYRGNRINAREGIMKKVTLLLVMAGLLLGCAIAAFAAGQGPEQVDLKARFQVEGSKKAVVFPHWRHQERLSCTKCHPSDAGGPLSVTIEAKTGMGNDFHKKLCWPCHIEMKVPRGKMCGTCHK